MSPIALDSTARLSDSLERDLLRANAGQGKSGPARKSLKLKRSWRGLLGLLDGLNAATTRVRAQSARLGGSHW